MTNGTAAWLKTIFWRNCKWPLDGIDEQYLYQFASCIRSGDEISPPKADWLQVSRPSPVDSKSPHFNRALRSGRDLLRREGASTSSSSRGSRHWFRGANDEECVELRTQRSPRDSHIFQRVYRQMCQERHSKRSSFGSHTGVSNDPITEPNWDGTCVGNTTAFSVQCCNQSHYLDLYSHPSVSVIQPPWMDHHSRNTRYLHLRYCW